MVLLFILAFIILLLSYLYLSNPTVDEDFTLPYSETATREINLALGEHVSIWLSTLPSGMSGRGAQLWVIKFYTTDPDNRTILDQLGIVGTGWMYPLTFITEQEGVHTMYFENSIGGTFDKKVSFSYRITRSVFGIPLEYILLAVTTAISVLTLIVLLMFLRERSREQFRVSRPNSTFLVEV